MGKSYELRRASRNWLGVAAWSKKLIITNHRPTFFTEPEVYETPPIRKIVYVFKLNQNQDEGWF